jgi:sialic acid synthase SpsE
MCIEIGGRRVGGGEPLFVIAELGLNHNGSVPQALALVDAAAAAGASAVKLQTIEADRLVTASCPPPSHVTVGSLRDFFRQFELDEEAHRQVASRARRHGLAFMSTPFSDAAVDLLDRVGCDALKIASGDITNRRLVERAAATRRPLVLSTGMSDLGEICAAVDWAQAAGARDLVLLHCVSAYPVPAGSENLAAIAELSRAFDVPVGLSDHTTEPMAASVAVALGAAVYERHFVLDAESAGVDRAVSSTPAELQQIVLEAGRVRRALGHGRKECLAAERGNLTASRRGLYASRPLRAGDVVAADAVVALRPAAGLQASRWQELIGITLTRDLPSGAAFVEADIEANHEARSFADVP